MKNDYSRSLRLKCIVCGDISSFKTNENKTWAKCIKCGKEYSDGLDEIMELNKTEIDQEINKIKKEVTEDARNDLQKMLRDIFKK